MYRIATILLLFLICYLPALAQSSTMQLPKVLPPSPDAAALGKYGEYPVTLSSGLATIEIPLYTIRSGKLQLPISLSYHGSGIRVDEVASWVGLGWVINAGGVLTRTVKGLADELGGAHYPIFYTTDEVNQLTLNSTVDGYLSGKASGLVDNESDVYAYNVNGMAGKFVYTINNELIQCPLSDNKIIANAGNSYQIISEDGTIYIFDVKEYTRHNAGLAVPTSFYLSKMIAADKSDTIYFDYFSDNTYYAQNYTNSNITEGNGIYTFNHPILSVVTTEQTKLLQKIRFSDGYIDFIAAGDRKDRRKYRLSQVNIYANNGVLKQSIKLYQDHFVSTTPHTPSTTDYNENICYRLKLDSVALLNNLGKPIGSYAFNYNTSSVLPSYWGAATSNNPNPKLYYGQDLSGYYNGVTSNTHFQNIKPVNWTNFELADRSYSPVAAQAAVLKEIRYPTGGRSVFTYESNATFETAGGLRIKKIESYANDQTIAHVKEYAYGVGFSFNNNFQIAGFENYAYTETRYDGIIPIPQDIYARNPNFTNSSNSVFYPQATEILTSGTGQKLGKIEYRYEYENDSVYIPNVYVPWFFEFKRFSYYVIDKSWARGPEKEVSTYGVLPDGSFTATPIKTVQHVYQKYAESMYKTGINVFRQDYAPSGSGTTAEDVRQQYQYFDIFLKTGAKLLSKTIETEYSSAGSIAKTTTYQYQAFNRAANPHWQMTASEEVNSYGDTIRETFQYPGDLAPAIVYAGMLARNIKSTVVKQLQTVNGGDSTGTYMQYGAYSGVGDTMYLPSGVQSYYKGLGFQDALLYDAYNDKGNIEQLHKAGDVSIAYLWNYNKTNPVAQVTNAAINQAAYTSFEVDDAGSWPIGNTSRITSDAATGIQCYRLENGSISKPALDPAKTYIVSYFTKSGASISVTGTQTTIQAQTHNGWIYFEKTITGVSSVTVSGSGLIDELRLYPKEAQMVTYTYEPLVGITSTCDANHRITYYEYDNYNRLKLVRDWDKNIIKTIDYNYKSGY